MNIMQHIKRSVILLSIVGVMSVSASENTKNRRSLRLIEKQRCAEEKRKKQALPRDDSLRNIMLQPIDAETFRKIVEESNNRGY